MQWNERRQNAALAQADVVLVIDSDVPWIGAVSHPRAGARIFHIDADPLKVQMPLWYIGAAMQCAADAAVGVAADSRGRGESLAGRPGCRNARRGSKRRTNCGRARSSGMSRCRRRD